MDKQTKIPEAPAHWNNNEASAWQSGWETGYEAALKKQNEELRLLRQKAFAFDQWIAKTNWVQEQIGTFPLIALAKHRADVMRDEIERLRALTADRNKHEGKSAQSTYECNADDCSWKGLESETVMCGSVGPLCPRCHETTELNATHSADPVSAGLSDQEIKDIAYDSGLPVGAAWAYHANIIAFARAIESRLSLAAQQADRLHQAWQILDHLDDALQKEGHIWNGPIRHPILRARDLIAAAPMPGQQEDM